MWWKFGPQCGSVEVVETLRGRPVKGRALGTSALERIHAAFIERVLTRVSCCKGAGLAPEPSLVSCLTRCSLPLAHVPAKLSFTMLIYGIVMIYVIHIIGNTCNDITKRVLTKDHRRGTTQSWTFNL
jgi:hypothetical protein